MGSIISVASCPCCGSNSIAKVLACKDYTVSRAVFEIWECADCTMRFTQDVPDQDSIGPYYQSDAYISHTDTEKGMVNKLYKLARSYTLNWKMAMVKKSLKAGVQTGALLDIGTGTGAFLHKASTAGWEVTGLEPDEGARKICKEKYGLETEAPWKLFELPGAKFDVVTMWHVLEHVHQLHEYMDQVKRVLKPHGVALIALPNYTSADARHYAAYWAAYDVPRHLYHFSPKAVEILVKHHGMKLESAKPMWLDAFYIALLSEGYKTGKGNLAGALANGLQSNLHAIQNKSTCSSLVYIIRPAN
ncbi:MAG: class SAM-dependent methyltransferase [Ferruginibacter sp.]|nr:class SAM-dependent methyltransferase [Ferruginibacter sp.]